MRQLKSELINVGRDFAANKWSLATSSNYSARLTDNQILITRSGVDKSIITEEDLIVIDCAGKVIEPKGAKSSAETLVHTAIYNFYPEVNAVLHTHSVFGTRLSLLNLDRGRLEISGYEMLKGFSGNQTHELPEVIPILANSQDMQMFSEKLPNMFKEHQNLHGFLIAGHGLYTWGGSVAESKRHIEAFEFLFECLAYEKLGL